MNTQQALQLAFQHLNSGNLLGATPLFERVLQQEPQNFSALNGRGFVALQQNRLAQSAEDFRRSLQINPKQVFSQKMLGIVLGAMGDFAGSMQAFDAAIALDRKDAEIYFNRSNFLYQAGKLDLALADLDVAIKIKPSYLEARSNRANLYLIKQSYALAEKDLDYVTDKVKNNPDLWVALGFVKHKLGKYKEALQANQRALALNPHHADALMNNSTVTFDLQDYAAAASWAEKALVASPNRAEAHYSLGKALAELARFDAALDAYNLTISINPQYAEAYMGRGLVKAALRDVEGGTADFDEAIRLKPDYDDAVYNKSYMHLEHQDFARGWQGYERRLGFPKYKDSLLPDIPLWDGDCIAGRLLVRGEQGLGDQILFASVLPDLLKRSYEICLQVEPRLIPLFQRSFPGVDIMPKTNVAPIGVVAQVPMGSLPRFFRQTLNDFGLAQVPYLVADQQKTERYIKALASCSERIIGVSWRSLNNRFADQKSIELKDLAPLFAIDGCVFVNLQYGDTKKEVAAAASQGMHFSDQVSVDLTGDIDSVASLINACDEIVSVSNSMVHIAGALGKKVSLMLPYRVGKFWYWSEAKSEKSLWYPSIQTFHQSAQGDWASTIDAVKASLMGQG